MKKLLFLVCALACSTSALSRIKGLENIQGEWGSGGGNALVCFVQAEIELGGKTLNFREWVEQNENTIPDELLPFIKSIEVFDLYEAKLKRGLSSVPVEIVEIAKNEKFYDYFDRLSKRFDDHVDRVSNIISDGQELIPDMNIMFHNSAVKHQNDLGHVSIPNDNCVISTMAAQVNFNGHYEVHIDDRLFNHRKHSRMSQATLILHELVYGIGRRDFSHKDSGATRNLVRQMISYHPSITQGSVSKSIYTLNFYNTYDDSFGKSEVFYHYSNSAIMESFSLHAENVRVKEMSVLDSFEKKILKGSLYKNLQALCQFADLECLFQNDTYFIETFYNLLKLGLNKCRPNCKVWSELKVKFEEEYRRDVIDEIIEFITITNKSSLDYFLLSRPYIENNQKRSLLYYYDYLFARDLQFVKDPTVISEKLNKKYQSKYNWINKIFNILTMDFLKPDGTVINSLRLNNIIPK